MNRGTGENCVKTEMILFLCVCTLMSFTSAPFQICKIKTSFKWCLVCTEKKHVHEK